MRALQAQPFFIWMPNHLHHASFAGATLFHLDAKPPKQLMQLRAHASHYWVHIAGILVTQRVVVCIFK
jgi:hypothetical protein